MKKLLATTAIATMAFTGAASAQSVLERVLAQTQSLGEVTGVFANVADNIGAPTTQVVGRVASDGTDNVFVNNATLADAQAAFDAAANAPVRTDFVAITVGGTTTGYVNPLTGEEISVAQWTALAVDAAARTTAANAAATAILPGTMTLAAALGGTAAIADIAGAGSIDGSITNFASRIDEATASVEEAVKSVESVTANFGNMATTVLGAVNTGEIGLGTNQLLEEAISGTSEAIRSTLTQVGTQTGQTVLALNSALNTMSINGSISNTFEGVNASVAAISPDVLQIATGAITNDDGDIIGSGMLQITGLDQLLGSMETTVLGAVNTGTIVSGVNNQVTGTVAGIVGNSATNMFAAAPTEE